MGYIHFENIHKDFGQNKVLKGITMDIEKGHLVTLLGPSGCGKSTLLRCLSGLEDVTSGQITMDGKDITHISPRDRGIGMVFQQYSLFPNMSVAQNVAFGLNMKKVPKDTIRRKVSEILTIVGLEDKAEQYPNQLSGGQQQRVALARAIVTEPKVLLLDEPLSAIDAKLRRNLQVEIRRIQQDFGMTTIFVTHDQDEAMVMSDVIHLFHNGLVEQSGTPTDLYTQPVSKFAASFIGNYNILSAADFQKASGEAVDCADVAIRPEIVRINLEVADESKRFHMEGKVIDSLSHGNLMRYTILCNGVEINADIMFEKSHLLEIGQQVRLSIRKTNVILLNS
ncbi:MAG: ABC transporter ATP-binding protein [Angelakisella sp.]|jgi:putative spermidine/putrescine transport system ATP-binding protein|nr:ABC transporter ATP-binding protein [Angelakisella sp.]MCI9668045.1 ABC transporter ATP-binding protein [Angelakisella sp.]